MPQVKVDAFEIKNATLSSSASNVTPDFMRGKAHLDFSNDFVSGFEVAKNLTEAGTKKANF
ncbi:MAG: hypothetical protein JST84_15415 [Acidobacteria bacterium]|nr:hypothetical protein [Acidobacteriota bacterium]